jgi:hypothetical protein
LVSGVVNKTLLIALLSEGNALTFESACQKALNLEFVAAEQQQMVKVERVDQIEMQQSHGRPATLRNFERSQRPQRYPTTTIIKTAITSKANI